MDIYNQLDMIFDTDSSLSNKQKIEKIQELLKNNKSELNELKVQIITMEKLKSMNISTDSVQSGLNSLKIELESKVKDEEILTNIESNLKESPQPKKRKKKRKKTIKKK
ncbi:MAG: hypothetical protein PHZ26_03125 [Candidatus Gracilibacteria bacterium]|nr:hypothetical protein [Candidatus Gracilibacteria bacterium]MDD2908720.1 hypothetical protein [Candidatus Gracilibacteria bacterium]